MWLQLKMCISSSDFVIFPFSKRDLYREEKMCHNTVDVKCGSIVCEAHIWVILCSYKILGFVRKKSQFTKGTLQK